MYQETHIAMKPRVLLVDELSFGLAPLVVDRLFEALIATAREDGTAVLLESYVS
jgi:branched-chain amino acid transport system ATP-binding protein